MKTSKLSQIIILVLTLLLVLPTSCVWVPLEPPEKETVNDGKQQNEDTSDEENTSEEE